MKELFENYQELDNLNEFSIKPLLGKGKQLVKKGLSKMSTKSAAKKNFDAGKKKGLSTGLKLGAAGTVAVGGGAYALGKKSGESGKKKSGKKKNVSESFEMPITKTQFIFDREVIKEIKNLSEAENFSYIEGRNEYFKRQRDTAAYYGYDLAAEYYGSKLI
jgi:hypothetical protein